MEKWIIWFTALYLSMFFALRLLTKYFGKYYHNKTNHLVMITYNSQHRVEWMIWSYHMYNENKGLKGKITCLDVGSIDDTTSILKKLQFRYPRVEIIELEPKNTEEGIQKWLKENNKNNGKIVVLDLREPDAEKEFEKYLA